MNDEAIKSLCRAVNSDQSKIEGYPYTGSQFYNIAVNFFKKDVDITKDCDFHKAYTSSSGDELLAYYAVAVLQKRFLGLIRSNFLLPHSEIDPFLWQGLAWELRLRDKIIAIQEKIPLVHSWLH